MSEQKKYLDFDGLSHFWEKTKEHIEDNTVPSTRTFLGAKLDRDIDLNYLWSAMGPEQKITTEICLNPIASIDQIFLYMGYVNDFTIITGKVLEDLSDLYEETGEATKVILPKGTYFIKSLDQSGFLAGCQNLNTGEMITVYLNTARLEDENGNEIGHRHWYTTTSSKTIKIEGIDATTVEGALQEIKATLDGLEDLLADI